MSFNSHSSINYIMNQHQHLDQEDIAPPRHGHDQRQRRSPPKKNVCIIIYTVSICLSCLYLQTQIFAGILNDRKAFYMSLFTYFDVFMCLWSYFQTIRIKNNVPKLRATPFVDNQNEKFFDYSYGITQKKCEVCNYYKFSRVSHCSSCGQCIYKLDHHCIWTQTCIGISNQKTFYLFCLYMAIGVIQFWYFTIRVMNEKSRPVLELMEPGVVIIWAITAFSAFFVGLMIIMLLISHTLMILTNYRTLDGMKTGKMCPVPFVSTDNDPTFLNLHDRGEIQNIKQIFGSNWMLWWVPLKREIDNEFFVQKMSPQPDKLSLMKSTNMYEIEQKYCKYMHQLSGQVVTLFVGKKMRVNNQVFTIQAQE